MKCAVIISIGPGQQADFDPCCQSIETAWAYGQGGFEAHDIIPIWDTTGAMSAAERLNLGIEIAAGRDCDWLFMMGVADLMNASAFQHLENFRGSLDAVWGNICVNQIGSEGVALVEHQPMTMDRIEDVLRCMPVLGISFPHFVRTQCALEVGFDLTIGTGAEYKYMLDLWERFSCAKVASVFAIERRAAKPEAGEVGSDVWEKAIQPYVLDKLQSCHVSSQVPFNEKTAQFSISNPFDIIQRHHCHGMFFEIKELEFLKNIVGSGKSIVEVGANIGNHLVYYAQHMSAQKIYPFEPNPEAIALLTRNIQANGLDAIIDDRGIGIGAGAAYGKFAIELPGDNNLGAARLKEGEGELEVFTLDEKLADTRYDFMKIDVEGMEFEVLAGAHQTIAKNRPILMIEVVRTRIPEFEQWCVDNHYRIVTTFHNVFAANFVAEAA